MSAHAIVVERHRRRAESGAALTARGAAGPGGLRTLHIHRGGRRQYKYERTQTIRSSGQLYGNVSVMIVQLTFTNESPSATLRWLTQDCAIPMNSVYIQYRDDMDIGVYGMCRL
jgi:hypothetical protein